MRRSQLFDDTTKHLDITHVVKPLGVVDFFGEIVILANMFVFFSGKCYAFAGYGFTIPFRWHSDGGIAILFQYVGACCGVTYGGIFFCKNRFGVFKIRFVFCDRRVDLFRIDEHGLGFGEKLISQIRCCWCDQTFWWFCFWSVDVVVGVTVSQLLSYIRFSCELGIDEWQFGNLLIVRVLRLLRRRSSFAASWWIRVFRDSE